MATDNDVAVHIHIHHGRAKRAVDDLGESTDRATRSTQKFGNSLFSLERLSATLVKAITSMIGVLIVFNLLITVPEKIIQGLVGAFKAGIEAIGEFQQSVVGLQAVLATTQQFEKDPFANFIASGKIATSIIEQLIKRGGELLVTTQEALIVTRELFAGGVGNYIKNVQEAVDLTILMSNVIASIATDENLRRQLSQEVKAALLGQVRTTDQIWRLVGKSSEEAKKFLASSRANKTLLQDMQRLFGPFVKAAELFAITLKGIRSSFVDLADRFARFALTDTFNKGIETAREMIRQFDAFLPLIQEAGAALDASLVVTFEEFAKFLGFTNRSFINFFEIIRESAPGTVSTITFLLTLFKNIYIVIKSIIDVLIVLVNFINNVAKEIFLDLGRAILILLAPDISLKDKAKLFSDILTGPYKIGKAAIDDYQKRTDNFVKHFADVTSDPFVASELAAQRVRDLSVTNLGRILAFEKQLEDLRKQKVKGGGIPESEETIKKRASQYEKLRDIVEGVIDTYSKLVTVDNKLIAAEVEYRKKVRETSEAVAKLTLIPLAERARTLQGLLRILQDVGNELRSQTATEMLRDAGQKQIQLLGKQEDQYKTLTDTIEKAIDAYTSLLAAQDPLIAADERYEKGVREVQETLKSLTHLSLFELAEAYSVIIPLLQKIREEEKRQGAFAETIKGAEIASEELRILTEDINNLIQRFELGISLGISLGNSFERISTAATLLANAIERDTALLASLEAQRSLPRTSKEAEDLESKIRQLNAQINNANILLVELGNTLSRSILVSFEQFQQILGNIADRNFINFFLQAKKLRTELKQLQAALEEAQHSEGADTAAIEAQIDATNSKIKAHALSIKAIFQDMIDSIREEPLVAFAAIGNALASVFETAIVKGEGFVKAFKGFLADILVAIGKWAIAKGTIMVLDGILFPNPKQVALGTALIAAGAAAMALAAVLGGGGSKGSGASAPAGGTADNRTVIFTPTAPQIQLQDQTNRALGDMGRTMDNLNTTMQSFATQPAGVVVKNGINAAKGDIKTIVKQGMQNDRSFRTSVAAETLESNL